MAEDAYTTLVREIEVERGRMTAHEQVCAERYKGIISAIGKLEGIAMATQASVAAQPQKLSRWAIHALVGIMSLMIGLIGWEAKQLYDLQPSRAAHATWASPFTATP